MASIVTEFRLIVPPRVDVPPKLFTAIGFNHDIGTYSILSHIITGAQCRPGVGKQRYATQTFLVGAIKWTPTLFIDFQPPGDMMKWLARSTERSVFVRTSGHRSSVQV